MSYPEEEFPEDSQAIEEFAKGFIKKNDIAFMTEPQRAEYYLLLCKHLGLNPLTMPIQYIAFQGRLVAYVTKGATDQLAARGKLSRVVLEGPDVREIDGSRFAYCKVRISTPDGREETSVAFLPAGRIDENLLMKCESKAKRRGTLSILGLGMVDESDADTMLGAEPVAAPAAISSAAVAEKKFANPANNLGLVGGISDEMVGNEIDEQITILGNEVSVKDDFAVGLAGIYCKWADRPEVNSDAFFKAMKLIAKGRQAATKFQEEVHRIVTTKKVLKDERKAVAIPPTAPAEPVAKAPVETSVEQVAKKVVLPAEQVAEYNAAVTALMKSESIAAIAQNLSILSSGFDDERKKIIWNSALVTGRKYAPETTDKKEIDKVVGAMIKKELKAIAEDAAKAAEAAVVAAVLDSAPQDPEKAFLLKGEDGAEAWHKHLAAFEKLEKDGGGAIAGAFAKRKADFTAAGVHDDRLRTTVRFVQVLRQHGEMEAVTFVSDICKRAAKSRHLQSGREVPGIA